MTPALHAALLAAFEAWDRSESEFARAYCVDRVTWRSTYKDRAPGSVRYMRDPGDAARMEALRKAGFWQEPAEPPAHPSDARSAPAYEGEGEEGRGAPAPTVTGAGPHAAPDIQRIREDAERRFAEKHRRSESKRHQTIRFPYGPVCIFFVGDQHIGNAGTDVRRMYEERDLILRTPGAYVWMMGDVVDGFIIGKLIAENMKPSTPIWEQWLLARDYLHSFGDRLVSVVSGNHDAWHLMLTGVDYAKDICPDGVLYDGDDIRASVYVGHSEVRVWARHQWMGNSIYNPTHGQERAARFNSADYDVYVGAHVHKGAMVREFVLNEQRKVSVLTGTYKQHDDFGLRMGFPQHDASTACALIINDDGSYFGTSSMAAAHNFMRRVYGRAA
jgi:hypothetical protein